MTVQAAIGPTTTASIRPSASRVLLITTVYLIAVVAAGIYPLISPLRSAGPITVEGQATLVVSGAIWLAVLLITIVRQPEGRLWKLIFLWALASRIYLFSYVPNSLIWSIARPLEILAVAVYLHLVIAYPTGYLRSRFDRTVVVYVYIFLLGQAALAHLFWEVTVGCVPECVRNLFVVWPSDELFRLVNDGVTVVGAMTVLPLLFVVLRRHWHEASPAGRRALLPIVVAVPIEAGVATAERFSYALGLGPGVAFFEGPSGDVLRLIVPLILPSSLLITLLRPRLSRGRMTGLVVELGRGVPLGGLRDVLARALGDPSLQLAFAAPSGSGYVDAAGQPVELPVDDPLRMVTRLERDDELLGILVHDPLLEVEDPGLLEAVGNAARMALENERLAAEVRAQLEEVRASRARIVEAADAERRRVERDLHDGAQQRLVALAMRLQVAKGTSPDKSDLLDEATAELETAIGEVRGLARGVHPTILSEAGLGAAVDALAERTPVPVSLEVVDRRYDPRIESTAYFVVAEALTNVARYASASEARIMIREEDRQLVVTVTDDGRGGADPAGGSGLRGLNDRIAAVAGRLTVQSPPDGGTVVRAELPLAAPDSVPPAEKATTQLTEPSVPSLARVRAVPAAHAIERPSRAGSTNPMALILGITGILAVLAVTAGVLGSRTGVIDGRADSFARPFVFQVPADGSITLDPKSPDLHVLTGQAADVGGISVWNVGDVVADHCSWKVDNPMTGREPGVSGLLAYLRAVPRLLVTDLGRTTVDGRPAQRVVLTVEDRDSECEDDGSLILWRVNGSQPDGSALAIQVPERNRVHLTVVDVDGATIAIEIWVGNGAERFDAWLVRAQRIVDSIRFLHSPAATSPTERSTTP